ncbi:MAG TPA: transglycosylase domain-containing protein [Candidatus Dormibacteraeota bacterium]|nr:transglycosylase domain-containing protein [Candidatus Dormibacteraeota bacterium]
MGRQIRRRAGLPARPRAPRDGAPGARGRGLRGWRGPLGLNAWQTGAAAVGGLILLGVLGFVALALTLPDPSQVAVHAGEIKFLDRNGKVIEDLAAGGEVRQTVAINQIAPLLQASTVAAEDRHFYEHHGIDFGRLAKAMTVDVIHRSNTQGASTITQQLAKVELLGGGTASRSITRKLKEAVLATEIEAQFSKSKILELYLNAIYYGHHAYGIQAASQVYFGKDAKDLDLAQASMLAGLPQAPAYYDPQVNFDAVKQKQRYVLDQLVRDSPVNGVSVTKAQADAAYAEDIKGQLKYKAEAATGPAPHFVQYVKQVLEQTYGNDQVNLGSGLTVRTTLDLDMQNKANTAVTTGLANLVKQGFGINRAGDGVDNAALLVTDERADERGQILAMVGSADFNNDAIAGQVNITKDSLRQPGSSFKPYDYVTGIANRTFDTLTAFDDTAAEAAALSPSSPVHDFDQSYQGRMTMRTALVESRNVPAEQAMQQAGPQNVVEMARRLGITSPLRPQLDTAIGGSEVTMMDHSEGYGVLATLGHKHPPVVILKVLNADQQDITQSTGDDQNVLPSGPAYIISDILKGYNARWHLGFDRPMAAKSGTTNVGTKTGDGWLMAYNPDVVVAGWAGKTSNDPGASHATHGFYGIYVGQQIVAPFVRAALTDKRWKDDFQRPADVTDTHCDPGVRDEGAPSGGELLWTQDPHPDCSGPSPSPTGAPSPSPTDVIATPSSAPGPPSPVPSPTPSSILPTGRPRPSPSPAATPSP